MRPLLPASGLGRALAGIASVALMGHLVTAMSEGAAAHQRALAPFADSGTLTLATWGADANLDPTSLTGAPATSIQHNIVEPLIRLDGAHIDRYVPALAARWIVNTNRSVYTFYLRQGVRFHTGRCCLAALDVQYALARTMAPGTPTAYLLSRFITNPSTQIKSVSRYTVQVELGRPQPMFLDALASDAIAVLDARALQVHTQKHDWGRAWAQDHDAGTGAYTIETVQHNQQVTLTRFLGYWGGWHGPHFSKVVVRTVPDAATRRELLERGQADLTFDLTAQDYDALRRNRAVRVSAPYGSEVGYIVMTEAGPLASPYARQALSYAFDYDANVRGVLRGYDRRAYGPIAPMLLGYDPHIFRYHTDLTKARSLLRKAGVKPGATLTVTFFGSRAQTGSLILQAQLARLGLAVKLQRVSEGAFFATFFGSAPARQRPNLMPFSMWPDYNDPYDLCVQIVASAAAGASGANGGWYHNAQVDALLAQMKTADTAALTHAAAQLQDIVVRQDPPAIWIDNPAKVTVMARNLRGFVFNPLVIYTYDFYALHR